MGTDGDGDRDRADGHGEKHQRDRIEFKDRGGARSDRHGTGIQFAEIAVDECSGTNEKNRDE